MVGFHAVAVALATPDEFDRLKAEGIDFKRIPKESILQIDQVNFAYKVSLSSLEAWDEIKTQLTELVEKVCEEYTAAKKRSLSEDVE